MSSDADRKQKALAMYQKRVREHKELEAKVKACTYRLLASFEECVILSLYRSLLASEVLDLVLTIFLGVNVLLNVVLVVRMDLKQLRTDYDKSEDDLKALQSVGQIIAEVLRRLDDERCTCNCVVCE